MNTITLIVLAVLCLCAALGMALNPSRSTAPPAAAATDVSVNAPTAQSVAGTLNAALTPTAVSVIVLSPNPTRTPEPLNGYISADNVDFPWPFTALGGRVMCLNSNEIVFKPDGGGTYAINGIARGAVKNGSANYKDLDEIWLDNPQSAGTKIPVQPVIEIGLKLCA